MKEEFRLFVGIDWATAAHEVCLLDAQGEVVGRRSVEHSGPGIEHFIEELAKRSEGMPARTAVAIEIPRGALVEALIERGFRVFALNPKQLDRFRDRHNVAGAKDDRRDAFVLADSLRTDQQCFRELELDNPIVVQLREWSRADEDLAQELRRLSNRLREQLHRYFPQVLKLSSAADDPWIWAVLKAAPTPAKAARLKATTIKAILREHRIRKVTVEEVLTELGRPSLFLAPGAAEAAADQVRLLLPRLRLVHEQRKSCAAHLEELLGELASAEVPDEERREHRDVEILRSLPGVGRVVAAAVLAEASQPLAERDYHALRSLAGIAPVTKQSGKSWVVGMRRACNGRLRNAFYHCARVASMKDEVMHNAYAEHRQRGHSHGRALRGIADRLLRILMGMLRSGTLYDATPRPRDTGACR
jgi:transposase